MYIRRATKEDISGINRLLNQVLTIHHNGRPDLFKGNTKKYTDSQLEEILSRDSSPVFCAADENENIMGYAFCRIIQHNHDNILTDIKTLYIDDLCVDETFRGQHVGTCLYNYVVEYAGKINCYNVTLNVWECNQDAKAFYEKLGLKPQKTGMEFIL